VIDKYGECVLFLCKKNVDGKVFVVQIRNKNR